ncbi:MAG: FHA domain-containing protein [Kofleriaceae bacterium]
MDQSKKTMRHFYCRDVLWETFEQMANDFDCSIDYLVNEAMRYYARSKNYQSPGNATGGPVPTNPGGNPNKSGGVVRPQPGTQPPPGGAPPRRQQPPTPGFSPSAIRQQPATNGPSPAPPVPQMAGAGPTLFLIYNGQRYPVTKDQFIIGRGSKTSDLPIKDGNISRKHAAVIRRNGTFYIKDLGSTNGIDYKGMRIDNKRIDEGDVFHLCDYELRFTYRVD